MDHQQIARRATSARTAFDDWVTAQIAQDPTIDPLALVNLAFLDLTQDGTFVRDWVLATMQDHIADRLARHGHHHDVVAPSPVPFATTAKIINGHDAPAGHHHRPYEKKAKAPGSWKSWLANEKVPVRTKLIRYDELVVIRDTERAQAAAHAVNARLAGTLLGRMTPGMKVGDAWTDEELREAVRASLAPAPLAAIPDNTERLEALS